MPLDADGLLLTADIITTDATGGEVRAQIGDAAKNVGYAQEVAIYGPDGFIGRPNDASGPDAARALYVQDGDENFIIGTRDNRFADKVGTMEPGDRAIVTDGEARVMIKQVRDAVVLYTVNQPEDKSMLIDLGGMEGEIKIINGGAVMTMTNDMITLATNSGGGTITIGPAGVTITGSAIQLVAPVVQLGDTGGGVVAPPSPATAVAYSAAGPANVVSAKVFVAP